MKYRGIQSRNNLDASSQCIMLCCVVHTAHDDSVWLGGDCASPVRCPCVDQLQQEGAHDAQDPGP